MRAKSEPPLLLSSQFGGDRLIEEVVRRGGENALYGNVGAFLRSGYVLRREANTAAPFLSGCSGCPGGLVHAERDEQPLRLGAFTRGPDCERIRNRSQLLAQRGMASCC